MHDHSIRRSIDRPDRHSSRRWLGQYLVESQALKDTDLLRALVLQRHQNAPLGHILVSQGWASEEQVLDALSLQFGLQRVDLDRHQIDAHLLGKKPAHFWLRHRALPLTISGQQLLVAIAHPEYFSTLQEDLKDEFPRLKPILAAKGKITSLLSSHFERELALQACDLPLSFSSRHLQSRHQAVLSVLLVAVAVALTTLAPVLFFTALCGLAFCSLTLFICLKLAGFVTHLANQGHIERQPPAAPSDRGSKPLPRISMLVPLYREANVSKDLLRRLKRLSYPRALLEVFLVLEEHDHVTSAALASVTLPNWMQIIEVPQLGALTTKPRAMNYALNFCNGDIIGVWDAEDAPARGQLEHVARKFDTTDKDVACLQGVLDYYNAHANWLSRCFTLEYASWFRIVLPGLARLGLVVPLGGTTLFVKREALEHLGGWDAYNVTEDADLGVRLCRAGYRTEMISTATHEEANCQVWPWIRQRSRWLKGFMMTYLVHMRHPRQLWSQLGWRRFLGFQAFFLGTVGQFLLAPFLWSFWLILLGQPHPSATVAPMPMLYMAAGALMLFELIGLSISITAAFASNRRMLALWAPTMIFYFPLGAIAAYKALHELIWHPFFWDKTTHGITTPPTDRNQPP